MSSSCLPATQQAAGSVRVRTMRPSCNLVRRCVLNSAEQQCCVVGWQDSCCMRKPGRREARPSGPLRQLQEASGKPELLHNRYKPGVCLGACASSHSDACFRGQACKGHTPRPWMLQLSAQQGGMSPAGGLTGTAWSRVCSCQACGSPKMASCTDFSAHMPSSEPPLHPSAKLRRLMSNGSQVEIAWVQHTHSAAAEASKPSTSAQHRPDHL